MIIENSTTSKQIIIYDQSAAVQFYIFGISCVHFLDNRLPRNIYMSLSTYIYNVILL